VRPHIILNLSMSLDGRVDDETDVLSNKLNDYRIELIRKDVDAILTTAAYVNHQNPTFPCADPDKRIAIYLIDKTVETNPKVDLIGKGSFDVSLVVPVNAIKSRIAALQGAKPDLKLIYNGDSAINIEELLWKLNKDGVHSILLEADYQTSMKMLNFKLVDDLYVLVSPLIIGSKRSAFEGAFDSSIGLNLDGITQYGDFVLLHYNLR